MDWVTLRDNDRYEINKEGSVRPRTGKRKGQVMKPTIGKRGYLTVNLQTDDGPKTKYIHRLLAETYLDNPENKPVIDHINRDRTDNRLENLRWATNQENNLNSRLPSTGERYITCNYRVCMPDQKVKSFSTLEEAVAYRDSLL